MSHTLAATRRSRWGVAVAAAAVGMLCLTSTASATIYRPANSTQFLTAVQAANATPGFDKIILPNETPISPATNLNITDDLYITGDHSWQAPNFQGPSLDGGSVDNRNQNFITVNAGVRFIFAGSTLTLSASPGFNVIQNNNGFVRIDNASIITNDGTVINQNQNSTGTSVITNTLFNANNGSAIISYANVTLLNSTITDHPSTGIGAPQGTLVMRNTVFDQPAGIPDCAVAALSAQSGNFDSDGTCGNAATGNPMLEFPFFYGGPTQSQPPMPGSPLINAGDPATCETTDQRFYPRSGGCDIGAFEDGATPDTTAPSCAVTAVRRGPDQQDVGVSDTASGIGYDAVFSEEITITNGTVANSLLPPTGLPGSVSRPGNRTLTASKADQLQRTRWSFTARDWAGNVRTCE